MRTRYKVIAISFLITGILNGCASSPEVKTLADKTAANVGAISVHLRRLSENSREIAEMRAANISRLHATNAELRARYQFDVELIKISGDGSNLKLIDDIEVWGKKVNDIFATADNVEANRKKDVLSAQMKLDTKSKTLADIALSLATLAKEEKQKDRNRFLRDYAKSLKKELEERLDKDDKAAKEAKALIDKTKDRIEAGVDKVKNRLN